MEIYSDSQVEQIKNIPSIKTENVLRLRIGTHGNVSKEQDDMLDFVEESETTEETIPSNDFTESFTLNKVDDIDLDDI